MQKLPGIFSPEATMALSDDSIEAIAAETDESKAERASSSKKLEILTKTLKVLHRLDRHNPRGRQIGAVDRTTPHLLKFDRYGRPRQRERRREPVERSWRSGRGVGRIGSVPRYCVERACRMPGQQGNSRHQIGRLEALNCVMRSRNHGKAECNGSYSDFYFDSGVSVTLNNSWFELFGLRSLVKKTPHQMKSFACVSNLFPKFLGPPCAQVYIRPIHSFVFLS